MALSLNLGSANLAFTSWQYLYRWPRFKGPFKVGLGMGRNGEILARDSNDVKGEGVLTKVEKEIPVDELIVNREEVPMGMCSRCGRERDPVEPPRHDFNRRSQLTLML
jgi:hypothetical protein